jgi:hypothetical protein
MLTLLSYVRNIYEYDPHKILELKEENNWK